MNLTSVCYQFGCGVDVISRPFCLRLVCDAGRRENSKCAEVCYEVSKGSERSGEVWDEKRLPCFERDLRREALLELEKG